MINMFLHVIWKWLKTMNLKSYLVNVSYFKEKKDEYYKVELI